jgi:hypothetical protein
LHFPTIVNESRPKAFFYAHGGFITGRRAAINVLRIWSNSHLGDDMKFQSKALMLAGLCCAGLISTGAVAQDVPDHPRVNEVNQRLDNQQARINQGVANGTMTGKQAARDETHDANIAKRESVDEAKHNGHLTKGEQNRLNRSENRNSRRIYRQKH